jgi:hypothetical protein
MCDKELLKTNCGAHELYLDRFRVPHRARRLAIIVEKLNLKGRYVIRFI